MEVWLRLSFAEQKPCAYEVPGGAHTGASAMHGVTRATGTDLHAPSLHASCAHHLAHAVPSTNQQGQQVSLLVLWQWAGMSPVRFSGITGSYVLALAMYARSSSGGRLSWLFSF